MGFQLVARWFGLALAAATTASSARVRLGPHAVSTRRLGQVLFCLQHDTLFRVRPPRFDKDGFRVRYVMGWLSDDRTPGGEDGVDVLHMIVYGPREETATLFEPSLRTENHIHEVLVTNMITTLKRERGHLVPDEIPGGIATELRIEHALPAIERQPAVRLKDADVRAGAIWCR